ncbi:sulfide/dihydroorotate dehydrogenase-like FAD/NAD-binding protein [Caloramator proteoclasticus]|uniref:Ferredoxin--NADP+ reductase n=1 Tax=Caloramator proteoclasticus DSM 10124 TaxID=1121262 RepID=A0A1M4VKK4_9CLOT|nr:sulfide/dihydroorotate dehydrogenase-like FAD/NAD-binding protein [Caloramator proteoclasticus]SHE69353.1 ferredoxin--NADP+ reductase [Caloramator proteoclasticus DSM 10124]
MYKILKKKTLAENIIMFEVKAPMVAKSAKPGQFVIVRIDEKGERIPLTICDYDKDLGTVTIVFQVVGASTKKMSKLSEGEFLLDFAGPLGNPSEFVSLNTDELKKKKFLFVAGGVGTAPVYPQVKYLREKGIDCDVVIGTRNKDLVILKDEIEALGCRLYICTDDGSLGFKGRVTDFMKKLFDEGNSYDEVVAIGPMIMMKFVCLLTKEYNIKTTVSLNSIMVDGTGMCGACRVTVGGETKFTCTDGPEFDGHLVDFDEAINRQNMFKDEEVRRLHHSRECSCF